MKKIVMLAAMLFIASLAAYAQDDYAKFELTGTLTVLRADIDILDNETMVGWGVGGQYNVNRWFGIVAEYTASHGASGPYDLTQDGTVYHIPELDTRVQTFLAGPACPTGCSMSRCSSTGGWARGRTSLTTTSASRITT